MLFRGERGTTLVEVLVTVMIIGIGFLALLGGLWTAVVASDSNVKLATAEATARAFAEFLKRQPYDDVNDHPCPASYNYATFIPPEHFTPTITSIEYWNPTEQDFGPCQTDNDAGQQLITVRVHSEDLRADEELQFVKRRTTDEEG